MARYQVILAYDGTDFQGYQRQKQESRLRTVQGIFENALRRIGWEGDSVLAAGRTDAGVHASGQVVAFDMEWKHSAEELQSALNANLPEDVAVQSICQTRPDFHPRYHALVRHYRYCIYCRPIPDPLRDRYSWRVWPEADVERMRRASDHLVGRKDFAAFGSPPHRKGTTIRRINQATWTVDKDNYSFDIMADGFLYHMVRRLVSMLVKIGQNYVPSDEILFYLNDPSASYQGGMAPARGLSLVKVTYHEG